MYYLLLYFMSSSQGLTILYHVIYFIVNKTPTNQRASTLVFLGVVIFKFHFIFSLTAGISLREFQKLNQ